MIDDEPEPNSRYLVTDKEFGHVGQADETFLPRYESRFGKKPGQLAWMNQVHGSKVEYVAKSAERSVLFSRTDGLWTDQKGIMLITKTADCVPILLWNNKDGIIAALHCGWRGFFTGIIESFFEICKKNNFAGKNFSVFLEPHLRLENFEVQDDFINAAPENKKNFIRDICGRKHYDITAGVKSVLSSFGVIDIKDSGIDTYANPDYFSYRVWTNTPEGKRPANYSTFANCIFMR